LDQSGIDEERDMKKSVRVSISILGFGIVSYALVQGGQVDEVEVSRLIEVLRIEPGDAVADVGAGDGRWAVALSPAVGDSGRVFATEVDANDLKQIRSRIERTGATNVTVVQGDQNETGLPGACCDAILLRRVYHHFQNPQLMQNELRAALRGDGRLLVIDFDTHRQWSRPAGVPESRDGHGISREMLVSEMKHSHFELVDEMKWTNGDYALVFRVAVID
jgi:SAM-dependent methyltransferase